MKTENIKYTDLTPSIINAILEDKQLKIWHQCINNLIETAYPLRVEITKTDIKTIYKDDVNELISNTRQLINNRIERIIQLHNKI